METMIEDRLQRHFPVIFLALLFNIYYIIPKSLAVTLEILFFLYLYLKQSNFVFFKKPIVWFLIFSLCLTATNIFRLDGNPLSINYLTTCVNCFIFVVMTYYVIRNKDDIELFVVAFGFSGFLFCLNLLPWVISSIRTGIRLGFNIVGDNQFLDSPITLGYMLMLIAVCQFWNIVRPSSKIIKILSVLSFLLTFSCVVLTGTRKALFAVIICIGVYLYLNNKKKVGKMLLYLFVGVTVMLFLYHLSINVDFLYAIIGQRIEGFSNFLLSFLTSYKVISVKPTSKS